MIKKNKKIILACLISSIIVGTLSVGATSLIYSKDVSYDNSTSGLKATTVQGALDEIYEKAKNAPNCSSDGVCTVSCPEGKTFFTTDTGYKCVETVGNQILKNNQIVTSGDGLYADTVTKGRYIYRGTNPKNYIKFNNETWRIISIESDGTLKIVRNEQLSGTQIWDSASNRSRSTSTYCAWASSYGCNAWAATGSLIGNSSNFTQYYPNGNKTDSAKYSGTVIGDSTMATYLNETYYNSLSSATKAKVVKGIFNVSTPGQYNDTESLKIDAEQEAGYQWKGYVALYTVTELLRASTNSNCTSLNVGYNSEDTGYCKSNNWLWQGFNTYGIEWTLSPQVSSGCYYVWIAYSSGYISGAYANAYYGVRPVLFLSSDLSLSGTGSSTDPYRIN